VDRIDDAKIAYRETLWQVSPRRQWRICKINTVFS